MNIHTHSESCSSEGLRTSYNQQTVVRDKQQMFFIRGYGTITRVAVMEGLGSSGSSQRLPSVINERPGSKSVAARAIIVNVFPRPMGSAMIPP